MDKNKSPPATQNSRILSPTMLVRESDAFPRIAMLAKSDFLDPDIRQDRLPQPYRMLDKMLNQIVENALDEAERRQREKESAQGERENPRLPIHYPYSIFGDSSVVCFCGTKGYMFYGTVTGEIVVVEPKTKATVTKLQVFGGSAVASISCVVKISAYIEVNPVFVIMAYSEKTISMLSFFNGILLPYITIDSTNQITQANLSQDAQFISLSYTDGNIEVIRLAPSPHVTEQSNEEDSVFVSLKTVATGSNSPSRAKSPPSREPSRAPSAMAGQVEKKPKEGSVASTKQYFSVLKITNPNGIPSETDTSGKSTAPSPVVNEKKSSNTQSKTSSSQKDLKAKKSAKPPSSTTDKKPKPQTIKSNEDEPQLVEAPQKILPQANFHFISINLEVKRIVNYSGTSSFFKKSQSVAKSLVLWWSGANKLMLFHLPADDTQTPISNPQAEKNFILPCPITCSAVDSTGRILACGHQDGSTIVWDMVLGTDIFLLSKQKTPITSVSFFKQSHVINSSVEGIVHLYDLTASGKLSIHKESVARVDYVSALMDVPIAVSMSQEGSIRLYSIFDRRIIAKLGMMSPWKLKPSGLFISCFDNFVSLLGFRETETDNDSTKMLVYFLGEMAISRSGDHSSLEINKVPGEMSSTPIPLPSEREADDSRSIRSGYTNGSLQENRHNSILPPSHTDRVRRLLAEKQYTRADRDARIARRQAELRQEVRASVGLPPDPSDTAAQTSFNTTKQRHATKTGAHK